MNAITVSIRDLHARTGHFVRKAAETTVIITDNGKPVAEIRPRNGKETENKPPYFARRKLLPGFKKLMESGALRPKPGDKSIDAILDAVKADSTACFFEIRAIWFASIGRIPAGRKCGLLRLR